MFMPTARYHPVLSKWLLLSALSVTTFNITANELPDAENAGQNGRSLYIQKGCYSCHGYEGQGGIISGPKLAPNPLPVEVFVMRVRRPVADMPAYSTRVLKDEELLEIYQYLQTIPLPPRVNILSE